MAVGWPFLSVWIAYLMHIIRVKIQSPILNLDEVSPLYYDVSQLLYEVGQLHYKVDHMSPNKVKSLT